MILKKTSLKGRLLIIILFTSFICVTLTSAAISYFGVYNIRHKMIADLDVTSNLIGGRIGVILGYDNPDNRKGISDVLENSYLPSTKKLCVYQASILETTFMTGKVSETQKACPTVEEMEQNIGKSYFSKNRLKSYKEIKFKDDVKGYLYIESDLSEIKDFISDQVITASIVILAVSIISFFLAKFMQGAISKPILHLVETTRKVSEDKNYSVRAENFLFGEDVNRNEISILIDAFNSMLAEVEERREMLLKKNQELVKARDLAESANRAKSQFLANISHELRTPLNAVIGFSDIIMQEMLGPIENKKYLEYSKDINESGEHLLHIINDVLDLSKAEAGKLEPVMREISLRKTLDECVGIITPRAITNAIDIAVELPPNLPPLVADRVMFKRIIMHLLSNAVKFTNRGGSIIVSGSYVKHEVDDNLDIFTIKVKDTGIGMSETDVELAFNSFTQLDGGLNRKYDGTGLGLPLSKKFMDLHGGNIRLESQLSVGTTAILTFYSKRS